MTAGLAAKPIYLFGNEEQKQKYLVPIARGEKLACFALTEAAAGSDATAIQTIKGEVEEKLTLTKKIEAETP